MVIAPPVVVPAPEPRGRRYGLLTAANGPLVLPPHGKAGGIIYEPVSCGFARQYPTLCHTEIQIGPKTFDGEDDRITRESFVVYATIACGSAGNTDPTLETRVQRRLANGEQTVAEAGMAAILAAGVIADGTALIVPGPTLPDVVGELEQWLYGSDALPAPADAQYGNVGYLHASPRIAAHAMDTDLLVQDGPFLRTRMGTIWVIGGGYPDNGTIYISGNITVWRSPDVFVSPPRQLLNLETNQYHLVAEREYVVSYDCVVASAIYDWGIPT
jgi:hypothetical protein